MYFQFCHQQEFCVYESAVGGGGLEGGCKVTNIRYTHRYKVYGKELEHVFAEKDLGVVIDAELNFEKQCRNKSTRRMQ